VWGGRRVRGTEWEKKKEIQTHGKHSNRIKSPQKNGGKKLCRKVAIWTEKGGWINAVEGREVKKLGGEGFRKKKRPVSVQ